MFNSHTIVSTGFMPEEIQLVYKLCSSVLKCYKTESLVRGNR